MHCIALRSGCQGHLRNWNKLEVVKDTPVTDSLAQIRLCCRRKQEGAVRNGLCSPERVGLMKAGLSRTIRTTKTLGLSRSLRRFIAAQL